MREILFRGKRIDNGGWMEGYLWIGNDCSYITPNNLGITYYEKELRIMAFAREVDPETVCQYTGLTDKNRKKIFEGDIVSTPLFTPPKMLICFIEGAFCLGNKNGEYVADIHYIHHAGINQTEVIGNIFDNPELLNQ